MHRSLLALILIAASSCLAHEPAPQMMGGMPQMDIFGQMMGVDPDEIIIDAFASKRQLLAGVSRLPQEHKDLEPRLVAYSKVIDRMRKDVGKLHSQEQLKHHAIAVRRYEKLAKACVAEPFDVTEVRRLINLIDQHNQLIQEIFSISFDQTAAQMVVQQEVAQQNSAPTQALLNDYTAYIEQDGPRIAAIQKQLKSIESALLRDDRTWKQKYGPLLIGTAAVLGIVIGGSIALNKVAGYFSKTPEARTV